MPIKLDFAQQNQMHNVKSTTFMYVN